METLKYGISVEILVIIVVYLASQWMVKTLLFCKPLNYLLHGSDGCGVFKELKEEK